VIFKPSRFEDGFSHFPVPQPGNPCGFRRDRAELFKAARRIGAPRQKRATDPTGESCYENSI
jgi:hypothetical protein